MIIIPSNAPLLSYGYDPAGTALQYVGNDSQTTSRIRTGENCFSFLFGNGVLHEHVESVYRCEHRINNARNNAVLKKFCKNGDK